MLYIFSRIHSNFLLYYTPVIIAKNYDFFGVTRARGAHAGNVDARIRRHVNARTRRHADARTRTAISKTGVNINHLPVSGQFSTRGCCKLNHGLQLTAKRIFLLSCLSIKKIAGFFLFASVSLVAVSLFVCRHVAINVKRRAFEQRDLLRNLK